MRRFTVVTIFLFSLLVIVSLSFGESIPRVINYQGTLTEINGTPVPDGSYTVEFNLYDVPSGGSSLWLEKWDGTTSSAIVTGGVFNVMLGTHNPLPANFFANHPVAYLGVKVGTDTEMLPRQRLSSVGYAFAAGNGIPKGGIIMWSGEATVIPEGWALCDGTNGTPNLVDRFVVGAGSIYPVAATGGESAHVLTSNEMPSHTHAQNAHTHGVTDPGHMHNYWYYFNTVGAGYPGGEDSNVPGGRDTSTSTTGISINGVVAQNLNTGGGQAHNILPPYFALAYIMKL